MSSRPRLKTHAQPLRRGPGSLQLGLCPDTGVVLDGLTEAEIVLAESLDGRMDIQTLRAEAAAAGVGADRVSDLISALTEHHLLIDRATDRAWLASRDGLGGQPRRADETATAIAAAYRLAGDGLDRVAARSTQHVAVSGEGDLPSALAELLRAGGIGRVSVGADAVDTLDLQLRDQRADQAHASFGSQAMDSSAMPDLVVLAAVGAIRSDAGEPWLRRGIPHLPLVVQAHRVLLGPLIIRSEGPCLSCMDLHRRDRDAAWPALLSQLSPVWPLRSDAPVNLESSLTAMTIGAAAMIVHTCLDGQPVPDDLCLELSLPWPAIRSRRWFRHPLCACATEHATIAR